MFSKLKKLVLKSMNFMPISNSHKINYTKQLIFLPNFFVTFIAFFRNLKENVLIITKK
jgi:hypothetical protein